MFKDFFLKNKISFFSIENIIRRHHDFRQIEMSYTLDKSELKFERIKLYYCHTHMLFAKSKWLNL